MVNKSSVTKRSPVSPLVGVIASPAALAKATRLRHPPDLFELRLDALRHSLGELERALPKLRAPLILTARHPAEGGCGELGLVARRGLLLRFLGHAAFVDLELRSVRQMNELIEQTRRRKIDLIISCHYLRDTPSLSALRRNAKTAAGADSAIFKVATRTDTPAQLARLISFFETTRASLSIAAMGIGKLGLTSRRQLARLGSVLTYVSLDEANIEGQASLSQIRRARRAYIR
jgi:3-dehydroquinate dehydratase-1